MKTNNLILGGGVSGLICLHYIKDSVLFEAGKDLAKDFLNDDFPKYIHNTKLTRELCDEIGVVPKLKKFKVGILFDGGIVDFFDLDMDTLMRIDIYNAYCDKKYGKLVKNKMNGFLTRNYSEEYIDNKKEIISKILDIYRERIYLEYRANEINLDKKQIWFNEDLFMDRVGKIEYENLISTIPINMFMKKARLDYKAKNKTLKLFILKCEKHKLSDYNFIYVADKNYDFHRIVINDDSIIFERNENQETCIDCLRFINENEIEFGDYNFKEFTFPICKAPEIKGVEFVGRFSTGDYSQKLDEVIKDARQIG